MAPSHRVTRRYRPSVGPSRRMADDRTTIRPTDCHGSDLGQSTGPDSCMDAWPRAYRAHIRHPIGEGTAWPASFRGILVLIMSVIMTTEQDQPAAGQKPPRRRRRRTSAQPSARPPDRPPEGGGGVRVPICIDTYPECVLILEVVDVGSTFLHMFATCRQSAFCKDI